MPPVTPKQEENSQPNISLNPVHVIAAILLVGETFRKSIPEKEMAAVAKRLVANAKLIVDAAKD